MGCNGYGHWKLELIPSWRLSRASVSVKIAPRQQRLLNALAIRGPANRSCLIGLLWPDCPNARALDSLRVSVHLVSRQAPGLIQTEGSLISLSDAVDVDLHRVRAKLEDLDNSQISQGTASLLRELRNADLLTGCYEDWVVFEQTRLKQDRIRAFTKIAREAFRQADYEVTVFAAEAALEIEPLYERSVRLLVEAHLELGNPAAAVLVYENYRRRLVEEMGLLPSQSITGLVGNVLGRRLPDRAQPSSGL
jgi:DNA-binding SARP family transcriptional activator